jgi:hypothetical protein
MIHPAFQPLAADAARLNGRRKIMRPPAKRKTPITRRDLKSANVATSRYEDFWLTVEFHRDMLNSLHEGSALANSLRGHQSSFLGFVEVHLQDSEQRNCREWCDDGESTESPSPAANIQFECLSGSWSCECGDHVRRRRESEGKSAVPQAGRVDCDDHVRVNRTGTAD